MLQVSCRILDILCIELTIDEIVASTMRAGRSCFWRNILPVCIASRTDYVIVTKGVLSAPHVSKISRTRMC